MSTSFTELAQRDDEQIVVDPDATEETPEPNDPEAPIMFVCAVCAESGNEKNAFTTQRGLTRHITAMHTKKKRKPRAKKEVVDPTPSTDLTIEECNAILDIIFPKGIPADATIISVVAALLDSISLIRERAASLQS